MHVVHGDQRVCEPRDVQQWYSVASFIHPRNELLMTYTASSTPTCGVAVVHIAEPSNLGAPAQMAALLVLIALEVKGLLRELPIALEPTEGHVPRARDFGARNLTSPIRQAIAVRVVVWVSAKLARLQ